MVVVAVVMVAMEVVVFGVAAAGLPAAVTLGKRRVLLLGGGVERGESASKGRVTVE